MAGEVTNRVIDELVSKGYDKATREVDRYASSQEKLARAQQRARQVSDTPQARRSLFRDFDAETRISRIDVQRMQNLKRMEAQTRLAPKETKTEKMPRRTPQNDRTRGFFSAFSSRAGIPGGGGIAASAFPGITMVGMAAGAAALALGKFAASSIAAAGATDKYRGQYDKATSNFTNAVKSLEVSVGSILMPSFVKVADVMSTFAEGAALMLDPKRFRDMAREAGTPGDAKRAGGFGAVMRDVFKNRPNPAMGLVDDAIRQMMTNISRGQLAGAFPDKDAIKERQFQRNLAIERQIEMTKERPARMRDLQRYVVGGGARAGVGVTPVELAAGRGMGARSQQGAIRITWAGTPNDNEILNGNALARLFEMFLSQAIRQGAVKPGDGRF